MRFVNRWTNALRRTTAAVSGITAPLAWIFVALSLAAILSQFYRSSTAVIAPELRRDLGLTPEALGMLTGAFFVAFACGQVPAGMLIDRYGSRRTISALLLFAIAGAVAFAVAPSLPTLIVARVLMGIGCSGIMMASFIVCSRWFGARNFTVTISVLLAVSNAGLLLATAPMAAAVDMIGWRGAFWVSAAVTAATAAIVFLRLQDAPTSKAYAEPRRESVRDMFGGLIEALANAQLPFVLAITFVGYGTLVTMLALWAAPYLHDVHGLDRIAAGDVLFFMVIAAIIGNVAYGVLERVLNTRKRLILAGGAGSVLTLMALAFASPSLPVAVLLLIALSAVNAFSPVIIAHSRSLFSERLVGRGMTTVNIFTMLGAGVLQVATGMIVGKSGEPSGPASLLAYRWVFAFLAGALAIALLIYSRARDPRAAKY